MRIHTALAGLASLGIALGLLATAPAQGAPSAPQPSGQALVRIDGGTAFAKEIAQGKYRIIVPGGAEISWLGEVEGKGPRIGTMSHRALIAGWKRLGHGDGKTAITTVTWKKQGSRLPLYRSIYVSQPRFDSQGRLTFIGKTQFGAPLPKRLEGFSINVALAQPAQPRSFSVLGANFTIYGTAPWVNATVTDVSKALVYWVNGDPTKPCITLPLGGNAAVKLSSVVSGSVSCGSVTIKPTTSDGKDSYGQITGPASGQTSVGTLFVSFGVTTGGSSTGSFDFQGQIAAWQRNGQPVCPATDTISTPCTPAT